MYIGQVTRHRDMKTLAGGVVEPPPRVFWLHASPDTVSEVLHYHWPGSFFTIWGLVRSISLFLGPSSLFLGPSSLHFSPALEFASRSALRSILSPLFFNRMKIIHIFTVSHHNNFFFYIFSFYLPSQQSFFYRPLF